jgi:hypothetical protein
MVRKSSPWTHEATLPVFASHLLPLNRHPSASSWAFYNLLMGCTYCQGAGVGSILTYATWSSVCEEKDNSLFPSDQKLPTLTSIPFWAQQDPDKWTEGRFNVEQAKQLASEGKPDYVQPDPSQSSLSNDKKKTSAGAIAGGVVVACAVAILVVAATLWYLRRRRDKYKQTREVQGPFGPQSHARVGSDVSQVTLSALPGHHGSDKSRPQVVNMLSWRSNVSSGGSSDIYPSSPPPDGMTINTSIASSGPLPTHGLSYASWTSRIASSQGTASPPPTQTELPIEHRIDPFPIEQRPSSPDAASQRTSEKVNSRIVSSPTREMVERTITDGPSTVPAFSEAAFTTTAESHGHAFIGGHRERLNPPAYCETPEPSTASMISRMATIPEPVHEPGHVLRSSDPAHRPNMSSWDSATSGVSLRGSSSSLRSAALSQPGNTMNSMMIVERADQAEHNTGRSVEM